MKTIKQLIVNTRTISITAIVLSAGIAFNANADNNAELYGDPAMNDVFPVQSVTIKEQPIRIINETKQIVWSTSYEEWVNPADFSSSAQQTLASALLEMENNPPAAGGGRSNQIFIWDDTADEYQLQ
ncbi:hypothetical protein [sulfur-oxidizing endosymbiont of Gigantopelta aegis]|uniref:hypothetical protein n=1 Tax=sulfur-oxidizing endosymbiont of Gigantopelta aegis TaxID=2794934 RepID=UPI0018DD9ECA|nr:hypothetical protein [sulfur-oxidizing endosymbiont of Gigantopelta aegis]